ncbi:MAG TPA: four helix bundle protein [Terriglobales bacterium]|nr:four helix bundle protein [Terriglobales bacterium]
MADFKQLKVWQKAHQVTLEIYRVTSRFPQTELYGLTSQMRRCAVSMGSNIAEGRGRDGDPDFGRFIQIAAGSAAELEYQLLVAKYLGYLPESEFTKLNTNLAEIGRMLISLRESVRSASAAS